MFRFFSLFLSTLFMFSCFAKDNMQHVVHNHCANYFSLNGDDYVYEKDDKDYWVRTGDLLLIEDYELIELPGGSFQSVAWLRSLEKKRVQCFKSRVMSKQKSITVLEAQEISRTTQDPKWLPGDYHPEVVYQVKLEDGCEYKLWTPFSCYQDKQMAEAVLASMIVEPGDTVTFDRVLHTSSKNPYICTQSVTLDHEGEKKEYNFDGPAHHASKPIKSPNIFKVLQVGIHNVGGLMPWSFEMVKFYDFIPHQPLMILESDFSMKELAQQSELQFVSTRGPYRFVFKALNSSKEVILTPWKAPGF